MVTEEEWPTPNLLQDAQGENFCPEQTDYLFGFLGLRTVRKAVILGIHHGLFPPGFTLDLQLFTTPASDRNHSVKHFEIPFASGFLFTQNCGLWTSSALVNNRAECKISSQFSFLKVHRQEYRQRGFFTHKAVSSSMALSPALLSFSNLEFYNLKPQPSNQAISSCFLLFYTSNLPFHLVTLWPMPLNHTWLKGTFGLYSPIHTRGLEEALIQMIQRKS